MQCFCFGAQGGEQDHYFKVRVHSQAHVRGQSHKYNNCRRQYLSSDTVDMYVHRFRGDCKGTLADMEKLFMEKATRAGFVLQNTNGGGANVYVPLATGHVVYAIAFHGRTTRCLRGHSDIRHNKRV